MRNFHISKRAAIPWQKAWLIRLIAILAALSVSAILIFSMTKLSPIAVYQAMFKASFETAPKFWTFLQKTAMLLIIALAVTPAFRMRFWNLGAEGQVQVGGLACTACMFYIKDKLPNALLLIIMLLASVTAGIVWAIIPAFFKAKWNTNETLFTLMMNYVAIQLVTFCIAVWVPTGSGVLPILNVSTRSGWLPYLGSNGFAGQRYLFGIIVVAMVTVVMYIYLKYSKHGYEISVVGESQNTARYIGINVKKVILRTVLLSGATCGLAGYLLVAGSGHTVSSGLASGNGFTAVLVSWLAKFNPFVMILTAAMIVFLQVGAGGIASSFKLDSSISDIITGIILFFIIGSEFFINYKLNFHSHSVEEGK